MLPPATLHGDDVTTAAIPASHATSTACTTISGWSDYTEYGTPKDATATAGVAGTVGYGWLGAKQRSTTEAFSFPPGSGSVLVKRPVAEL